MFHVSSPPPTPLQNTLFYYLQDFEAIVAYYSDGCNYTLNNISFIITVIHNNILLACRASTRLLGRACGLLVARFVYYTSNFLHTGIIIRVGVISAVISLQYYYYNLLMKKHYYYYVMIVH